MKETVKIQVNKEDELPVVAERVFSAPADEIVLIVPKFSKLAESADSLRFLKKGLAGKRKTLLVESVDDKILKLAKRAGLAAQNPFFARAPEPLKMEDPAEPEGNVGDDAFKELEKELETTFASTPPKRILIKKPKKLIGVLAVLVLAVAGVWLATSFLQKADISIITQKQDWKFEGEVVVDKNASASDLLSLKIPGQLFSQERNAQIFFPASGKKTVKDKAVGKILIYNAYSSSPQPLVATTRFETPDGKIVRINEGVTVPGAKIVDGRIVPSFIEAAVTADKPGEEYNIGPVAKLVVPGFKNSPKYNGFYGEIREPLSGGYVGERAYPTDEDIKLAKKKSEEELRESLKALLASQVPDNFRTTTDNGRFRILKQTVNTRVNDKNEFSIFTEASYTAIAFKEKDLLLALTNKIKEEKNGDFAVKSYNLDYGVKVVDWEEGKMNLAVNFNAVIGKPIDVKDLRRRIAGRSKDDLKALVFSLPGLEKVNISLWPFWVSKVPGEENKINITVD